MPAAQSRFRHIAPKVDRATFDDIDRRLQAALKVEFTVDPEHVAQIDAIRRADAHAELRRWLAGERRPNNTERELAARK